MQGTEVNVKFKNQVTGQAKLERYAETLDKIYAVLGAVDAGKAKVIAQASQDTKGFSNGLSKMGKDLSVVAMVQKLNFAFKALSKTAKLAGQAISKSADYSENIDLFMVSMHGAEKEALKFVNTASEMYGLDDSALYRSIGVFKQMSNAMGYAEETSRKLTLQLAQMQIDISSLYNVDVDRAGKVLQSAMSQQTEAIRALTGADITQMNLQGILDKAGMDRLVRGLTQAEKRLLIMVSLTEQLKEAPDDFGRTIEGTAQQITVLKQQWEMFVRNMGSVFMPLITTVLPYLNAILMVLNAITKTLAALFGYKPEEHDLPSQMGSAFDGATDSVNGTANAVKKLKQGLRGFDKLNNITTPTDSGGTSGRPSGNYVDPKIMDLFNAANEKYMKQLSEIEMKATRIRDTVMGWLGFTKQVNEETGEVTWLFEGIAGIDFAPLSESWTNFVNATKELVGEAVFPVLLALWDKILKPLGVFTINELLPNTLNLLAAALRAVNDISKILIPVFLELWDTFFVPIAKITGWVVIKLIEKLTEVLTDFSKWAKQNEAIVGSVTRLIVSFLGSLWTYHTTKKVVVFIEKLTAAFGAGGLTKILKELNIPLLISVAAFATLAWGIYEITKNWSKMNAMEKTISILGGVALAATAAAVALGALQSAWSLGLAAVAIAAGVSTILYAVNNANKRATDGIKVPSIGASGRFAQGGLPEKGQLFVANEEGPELIGQIGGQSFVANQSQMMDLLDGKMNGSSAPINLTVQIGDEVVAEKVIKDLGELAKSNGQPIEIY